MESCGHLEQVNLQMKGKTQGCEECEKLGLTGYIYDCVCHVGM